MGLKFFAALLAAMALSVLVLVFIRRVRGEDEERPDSVLNRGIRAMGWVFLACAGLLAGTFAYRNMPILPVHYEETEEFGRIVFSFATGIAVPLLLLRFKYWAKELKRNYFDPVVDFLDW